MWNNALSRIVKYPASQDVKCNSFPHAPQRISGSLASDSLPQAISLVPKERISLKNPLLCKGFFYGVSSGSRTHDLQGHNLAL